MTEELQVLITSALIVIGIVLLIVIGRLMAAIDDLNKVTVRVNASADALIASEANKVPAAAVETAVTTLSNVADKLDAQTTANGGTVPPPAA